MYRKSKLFSKILEIKLFVKHMHICIELQAKEEDEKAKVIQKAYREKMRKRKEQEEQEASASVIQK